VSKAVLKLEERLGVKLLARTSRSVTLTPEGAGFMERCREAISSLQAGHEQLSQSRGLPRGELSLSVPFILGKVVVPALPRLSARYPDLTFRVTMTDRLVRLVEEQVDVGVRVGARADSSLVSRMLGSSRWVAVAAPAYLARFGEPATPEDLEGHACAQFVTPSGRPREWTFTDGRGGEPREVKVEGRLRIDQGEQMLEAAAAGFGICQVLDFMVGERLADGRLQEVLRRFSAAGPPIHAVAAPERARSPNVKACFAFLADVFARVERAERAPARP
jgi:DNA-binding transcriptional LysR family regulator